MFPYIYASSYQQLLKSNSLLISFLKQPTDYHEQGLIRSIYILSSYIANLQIANLCGLF